MSKYISVWYDETSDYTEPRWVVSIEDGDGSETISQHEDRDDAMASAQKHAARLGLDVDAED